tara:strand:+ start:118 stop:330 length:213 start_codon:yes stop_codon:yes gene_type:complete
MNNTLFDNEITSVCGSYTELISGILNILLLATTITSELLAKSKCHANAIHEIGKKKKEDIPKDLSFSNIA